MKTLYQRFCNVLPRAAVAVLVGTIAIAPAAAQDPKAKAPAPAATPISAPVVADRPVDSEVARYCGALAPSASEARATYQLRRLADLESEVREEVAKLEKKEASTREWVLKRDNMMKDATDDVVAIYAKMDPESAAAELAVMDEVIASAVLSKLSPRAASAILGSMAADKAAKLSTLIAGALVADKS
jgi:flagellar motility protein MotE (MotC chaperone)